MKKIILTILVLLFALFGASCNRATPLDNITMNLSDTQYFENSSIKFSKNHNFSANYYITPNGFDWEKLQEKGYYMQITITYDVYYKKDWTVGVGYMGSPKYEISVTNSDGIRKTDKDLTTKKSIQTRTFSLLSSASDLKDTKLVLTFSTDNIQNIIYFSNIKIDYQCYI